MELLKLISRDSYITYNKLIAKEIGVDESILFGELCSMSSMYGDEFFCDQSRLTDDTCLTEYRMRNALKNLKSIGLVTVERKGIPAKNYYSLNEERLVELLRLRRTSSVKFDRTGSVNFGGSCTPKIDTTINKNIKIKKENKNKENIYKPSEVKEVRHRYGEYNNVLLTDEQYEKLQEEFPLDYHERIERLSEYIESTGKTYKNHLATIRSWAKRDSKGSGKGMRPPQPPAPKKPSSKWMDYPSDEEMNKMFGGEGWKDID